MRLFTQRAAADAQASGTVRLPFERRQRSRLRVEIADGPLAGESVGFDLPRGTVLRGGDQISSADGQVVRVDAAVESLAHIDATAATELARIAYHLGNRHVPVQVGDGYLRMQRDHVLERMVAGLGGQVSAVDAAFEPESGAYGQAGAHSHAHEHPDDTHVQASPQENDRRHAPRIHDLLENRSKDQ